MSNVLDALVSFVKRHHGINDKHRLRELVVAEFGLTRDRSVYYRAEFAIRFSSAASLSFSNTVLSLSNLRKFDDRPFVVCLTTPSENRLLLANTTLLRKISHSSHALRENNIRGSFNGSDIARDLEGISNAPDNLSRLFVGVDPGKIVDTVLVSMFQKRLLAATITLKHWAGRNSRGVTQFEGRTVGELIKNPESEIDIAAATTFLRRIIDL